MSDIVPALTAEEWEFAKTHQVEWAIGESGHSTAARILYGQTFGFTREDVTLIHKMLYGPHDYMREDGEALAARIAALLPPE